MASTIGVGTSQHADTARAFAEAAEQATARLGGAANLCVIFCSGGHLRRPEEALAAVRRRVGGAALIGCGAGGLVAGEREWENATGAVVWAARTDGEAQAHHLRATRAPEGVEMQPLPTGWEALILLADPYTFATEAVLAELADAEPGRPVLGGLASAALGGSTVLFCNDAVVREGAVALALSGVPVVPGVSQGAGPVGPELTITESDGHVIGELDGKPPMRALRDVLTALPERERRLAEAGVMLGIAVGERPEAPGPPAYLVRPILGADEQTQTITVGDRVDDSLTVRLHVRDGRSADEDLRGTLQVQSQALGAAGAAGALLFTCNGRGRNMFEVPDHDAAAVTDALGVPPAGFFCAGEIGPVGGHNFLHGFTATLAVFPAE